MLDGNPNHDRIALRITVPGNAAVFEYDQTYHHPRTMKRPSLKDQFGAGESSGDDEMFKESGHSMNDQITKAIVDALSANDKVIEIRPAKRSTRMGLIRLLLLGAGAIGFAYWVQNSQKPDDLIRSVKKQTATSTHQAAESIEEGSEAASERIEEGSERAGEAVQEAGKKVAEQTEEAGEKAAEKTDSDATRSSKKATGKTDSDAKRSSKT